MKYREWKTRGNDIICAGSGAVVAQVNVGWPDDEIASHARLIAAAPGMYEALIDFTYAHRRGIPTEIKAAYRKAMKAIAKSEGR